MMYSKIYQYINIGTYIKYGYIQVSSPCEAWIIFLNGNKITKIGLYEFNNKLMIFFSVLFKWL